MPRAASALLLLMLTACPDSAALTGIAGPELDFVAHQTTFRAGVTSSAEGEAPRVESWPGKVVVRGRISAGTPCHHANGRLRARRGEIVLRVATSPYRRGGCADVEATFEYLADVGPLEPGRYRLRVLHRSHGREQAVLDRNVRVRSR